jgi:hypothetical protein
VWITNSVLWETRDALVQTLGIELGTTTGLRLAITIRLGETLLWIAWMKLLSGPSQNSDSVLDAQVIFPVGTYYPQVRPQAVENTMDLGRGFDRTSSHG